jgi:hypothetical protein
MHQKSKRSSVSSKLGAHSVASSKQQKERSRITSELL